MKFNKRALTGLFGFVAAWVLLVVLYKMLKHRKEGFDGQTLVTLYHMVGCGWCQKFKPEWEKFKDMAQKAGIQTKEVEASEDPSLIEKKGIQGFPTVRVEKNGKEVDYSGDRTAQDLMKYMLSA
jgi:thiol-disulfide isomerase/thioredoxin